MAQTIYAPIQTGNLSEIAAAPFRERERQVMTRIANAEKATEQTGIYDVNTSGLAPNMQAIAQPWIESIKKNMTEGFYANDTQRVNVARRQAQELQTFLESGKLATRAATESMIYGEKNLWRGVSLDEKEAKELYSDQTQKPFNIQYDPSGYPLFVNSTGGLESPLGISSLNPQNYFMVTEAAKLGKNMNPVNYVETYSDLFINAKDAKEAVSIITERVNEDLKLGTIPDDDYIMAGLLANKYRGKTIEELGQTTYIEDMNKIKNDPALAEIKEKYKSEYVNNSVAYATQVWESNQAAAARRVTPATPKAAKFNKRATTIDLGDGKSSPATQYTLTEPLSIGAKKFFNFYQTQDGQWYGFSVTNKQAGSKTFSEQEILKLNNFETDKVIATLEIKGASKVNNTASRLLNRK